MSNQQIYGVIGAVAGFFIGGPSGIQYGFLAGPAVGAPLLGIDDPLAGIVRDSAGDDDLTKELQP